MPAEIDPRFRAKIEKMPNAPAGWVIQDLLGISRRDGETVRDALARYDAIREAESADRHRHDEGF